MVFRITALDSIIRHAKSNSKSGTFFWNQKPWVSGAPPSQYADALGWRHDGPRALIPRALRSRYACVCVARARRFCCARRCLPTSLVTRLGVTRHDCFCAAAVLDIFRFRLRIDFLSVFHCALCTQTLWGTKGIQKTIKKCQCFQIENGA